jgi:hypothetical protein
MRSHAIHIVTAWLGNTPRVALKNYLMVTDEDFERATQSGAESGALHAQTAHKQAQRVSASVRDNPRESPLPPVETGVSASTGENPRTDAKIKSRPGRTRTYDQSIMSRLL